MALATEGRTREYPELRAQGAVLLLALIHALSGCAYNPAPITSLEQPPSRRINYHLVEPGDTLYSIAWRYDLDYRDLATANGLSQPYHLRRGERLNLDVSAVSTSSTQSPATAVRTHPVQDTRVHSSPVVAPAKTPEISQHSSPVGSRPSQAALPRRDPQSWQWPVSGKVVKDYNPAQLQKGISIKSLSRAAVRAAAPGTVVYAGDGLRGYGKLVIIKHSELLLSAYGQNESLMVSEGQSVQSDSIISRLGNDGTLYFEIRRDGVPVNPNSYLN